MSSIATSHTETWLGQRPWRCRWGRVRSRVAVGDLASPPGSDRHDRPAGHMCAPPRPAGRQTSRTRTRAGVGPRPGPPPVRHTRPSSSPSAVTMAPSALDSSRGLSDPPPDIGRWRSVPGHHCIDPIRSKSIISCHLARSVYAGDVEGIHFVRFGKHPGQVVSRNRFGGLLRGASGSRVDSQTILRTPRL